MELSDSEFRKGNYTVGNQFKCTRQGNSFNHFIHPYSVIEDKSASLISHWWVSFFVIFGFEMLVAIPSIQEKSEKMKDARKKGESKGRKSNDKEK